MLLGHHSLFLGLLDFSKHENLPLLLWNVPGTLGPDTSLMLQGRPPGPGREGGRMAWWGRGPQGS